MFFSKSGILGINARNLLYIRPFNKEKSVEIADDKLKTKAFLSARGIPVPKLLDVVGSSKEISKFSFKKLGSEFVLKPNLGFGGEGIIPIIRKQDSLFISGKNKSYSKYDLIEHIRDILNGDYSITDKPDKAFFEKLIISDEILGRYSYQGLPDIRVIVHNLVPVMAMLRLPTADSDGKANLHQGAIGAGIDLAKGEITHLLHRNQIIKEVPGFGSIKGLKIPFWDDVLRIACKAQLATNLGYMGADIAIDKYQGPVLLEINARAGIGIQLANLQPLRKRLEKLENVQVSTIEKGIRIAKDMFGYSIEKDIRTLSGKKVIGMYEPIEFLNLPENLSSIAFINTSRKKSYLSLDLAKQLGIIKSKKAKNLDDVSAKLKFKLAGKKLTSIFKIDKQIKKKYQVIIGNRDIAGQFLVDTGINNHISIKNGNTNKIFLSHYNPLETDRQLSKVNNQLKFLSHFRPLNFSEEISKFEINNNYNPQFVYGDFSEQYQQFKKTLKKINYDETDLGQLFKRKSQELELQLELIMARGSQEFTNVSSRLFGIPTLSEIAEITAIPNYSKPPKIFNKYSSLELKAIFEETLNDYGLNDWRVAISDKILARCITNKNKKILIKSNSIFSEERVKALIIHEIETHLLTAENGHRQKYKLFNYGFANYLATQEGLAMHNVLSNSDLKSEEGHKEKLTESIHLSQTMSFAELFNDLRNKNLTQKSALDICIRVKRGMTDTSQGGAFTKDYSYYSGKKIIRNFLDQGGDLRDLYHGKYNLSDLPVIKTISLFQIPPLLPKWLK